MSREPLDPHAANVYERRYATAVAPALRDGLREFLRTAKRRRLTLKEVEMGQAMVDELEYRGKEGKRG